MSKLEKWKQKKQAFDNWNCYSNEHRYEELEKFCIHFLEEAIKDVGDVQERTQTST